METKPWNSFCKEVFHRIGNLLKMKSSVIVAIDGNSGSGKSTFAELIREKYDCNVFHMDDFFLTPVLRTPERLAEPGGNVDYARFKAEVITGLQSGVGFQYQVYNCSKQVLDHTIEVKPKSLNVIEGSYSMHPTLTEPYDLKIFLGIGSEEQSRRILERNGPILHQKFLNVWIPLENRYFEELKIRENCDLIYNL
jgi:uridine kinase